MGSQATTVHVCVTCRDADDIETADSKCRGLRLYEALDAAASPDHEVSIAPVECLAVCKRPCTIAFTAPGKLTYVFGDLDPETGAADVLEGARVYSQSETGLMAWRERPRPLRRGTIARIPSSPLSPPASEAAE